MSHLHHGTYDPTIFEASDWWKASNFGTPPGSLLILPAVERNDTRLL